MRTGAARSGFRFPRRLTITRLAGLLAAILLCASTGFGRRGRIIIDDPRRFPVGIGEMASSLPAAPVIAPDGGRFMVFIGRDPDGTPSVFRTDGTRGGTTALGAPWPAGTWPGYSQLRASSGVAWFLARAEGGEGLYRCDGTAAGTALVTLTGATGANEWDGVTPCGGRLFFTGRVMGSPDLILFVSDGTPEGTHPVRRDGRPVVSGTSSPTYGYRPNLLAWGNLLYFPGWNADTGTELWRSDGTEAGTFSLGGFTYDAVSPFVVPFGSGVVFRAVRGGLGEGLWSTDGSIEGTRLVKAMALGPPGPTPWIFGEIGGRLLFSAEDPVDGPTLWSTDGTEEGTREVRAFDYDEIPQFPLGVLGERFYFILQHNDDSTDLWSTDGTERGTGLAVMDFPYPQVGAKFQVLPGTGSAFLLGPRFDWEDSVVITDGTPEGTRQGGNAVFLQVWKGALYETHSCCALDRVPPGASGISESAVDDDGDGYSTEEEVALGSDWADPLSRPPGAPPIAEVQPLSVRGASARLSILDSGTDSLRLAGILPAAAGPSLEGQTVTVDAGGVLRTFTLDASGRSRPRGPESLRLRVRRVRGEIPGDLAAPFVLTLRKADLAVHLADEGLWPDPVAAPAARTLPVTILWSGGAFRTAVPLEWRVERRGVGRARLTTPR